MKKNHISSVCNEQNYTNSTKWKLQFGPFERTAFKGKITKKSSWDIISDIIYISFDFRNIDTVYWMRENFCKILQESYKKSYNPHGLQIVT